MLPDKKNSEVHPTETEELINLLHGHMQGRMLIHKRDHTRMRSGFSEKRSSVQDGKPYLVDLLAPTCILFVKDHRIWQLRFLGAVCHSRVPDMKLARHIHVIADS